MPDAARLLKLYPKAWRARYGDEFLELLGDSRLTLRNTFDVVSGAVDARLTSWRATPGTRGAESTGSNGGAAVLQMLRLGCQPSARLTTRDHMTGAGVMLGLTLLLTIAGVAVNRAGFESAGDFVMYMGFFTGVQVSMLFTYLKEQPARVKFLMTVVPLAIVAALIGGSIWIAATT